MAKGHQGTPMRTTKSLMKTKLHYLFMVEALAALALLALPAPVQAQFTFTTNGFGITITGYTGTNAVVIIPNATNGYPVTTIGASAFSGTRVTSVTIPARRDQHRPIGVRCLLQSDQRGDARHGPQHRG